MKQAEIKVHLLKNIVDEVNTCIANIEEGWSWKRVGKGLPTFVWTAEMEAEDKEEEISPEELTVRKVQELASMLVDGIKFMVVLPERHKEKKVPMLDLCV